MLFRSHCLSYQISSARGRLALAGMLVGVLVVAFGSAGCGSEPEYRFDLPGPELEDIEVRDIGFENPLGEWIEGSLMIPPGPGAKPAVVVMHGGGGLYYEGEANGERRKFGNQFADWGRLLYEQGYAVLMPASFYSRGFYHWDLRPSGLYDKEDRLVMRVHDAYGALDFACEQPEIDCDRVAIMGFSNGGSVSAMVMHEGLHKVPRMDALGPDRPRFVVSIPYYPGCGWWGLVSLQLEDPNKFYAPYGPVHVHHAEEDTLLDDCQRRLAQTDMLIDLGVHDRSRFALDVHRDAGHGFDSSPEDQLEERARDRGRAFTLDLLATTL